MKMTQRYLMAMVLMISTRGYSGDRDTIVDQQIAKAYENSPKVTPKVPRTQYTLLDYSSMGFYKPIPTRSSYLLPYTHMDRPNNLPFEEHEAKLQNAEVKFQVSFQFPLIPNLAKHHHLYFSYSQLSLWQAFNKELSAPFRETNYSPELWYAYSFKPLGERGRRLSTGLGFSHESNGRQVKFSRSWNKVVGFVKLVDPRWELTLKGWSRLAEEPKTSPDDPSGDDNPDLTDYVGYGELSARWNLSPYQQAAVRVRNNLKFGDDRKNYGMVEASYSFNLGAAYWWELVYFSGHGESLIDYNHNITRVGIGIKIPDLEPLH